MAKDIKPEQTTIYIRPDVKMEIKRFCLEQAISMGDLFELFWTCSDDIQKRMYVRRRDYRRHDSRKK